MNNRSGNIRKASELDLQEILQLLEINKLPIIGVQPYVHHFLVWETDSDISSEFHIIGCVGFEKYGKNAILRSLSVHPQHQNQGIGTQLLNSIIQHTIMMQIKALYLLTTTAEDFFEKHQFHPINRDYVPLEIKGSLEFSILCPSTAVCMMKRLDS